LLGTFPGKKIWEPSKIILVLERHMCYITGALEIIIKGQRAFQDIYQRSNLNIFNLIALCYSYCSSAYRLLGTLPENCPRAFQDSYCISSSRYVCLLHCRRFKIIHIDLRTFQDTYQCWNSNFFKLKLNSIVIIFKYEYCYPYWDYVSS
jgi:hypothetical protein